MFFFYCNLIRVGTICHTETVALVVVVSTTHRNSSIAKGIHTSTQYNTRRALAYLVHSFIHSYIRLFFSFRDGMQIRSNFIFTGCIFGMQSLVVARTNRLPLDLVQKESVKK